MNLRALLIGIDVYDGGGNLRGCVNDVDAVQRVLVDRLDIPDEHIKRLVSSYPDGSEESMNADEVPTLEAIKRELALLGSDEVSSSDRVLIYYSGHGTQLKFKDAKGHQFAREALVPKDKRVDAGDLRYLADWELNAYIAAIAGRCHSATVVLDCCCSAGVTRDLDFDTGTPRFAVTEGVIDLEIGQEEQSPYGLDRSVLGDVDKCQVVAACHASQAAVEAEGENGLIMGHLTRALCEQLSRYEYQELEELRWGHIWRQVEADVVAKNAHQRPWISGGFGRKVFGAGQDAEGDPGFAVEKRKGLFELGAGTLAGVTKDALVGIYGLDPPVFPNLNSAEDNEARLADVEVTKADLATAQARAVDEDFELPEAARARLVQPGNEARLTVFLKPTVEPLKSELEQSSFIRIVDDARKAALELVQVDGGWMLVDELHGLEPNTPRFPKIEKGRWQSARLMLEHYYVYSLPLRFAHRCQDLPRTLDVLPLKCKEKRYGDNAQEVFLPEIERLDGRHHIKDGELLCIALHNHSDLELHVTLFDVGASGMVFNLGKSSIPARARYRFWAGSTLGVPFQASIPNHHSLGVDRIVAIGTTDPALDLSHLEVRDSFEKILRPQRATKDLGPQRKEEIRMERYTSAIAYLWISSA